MFALAIGSVGMMGAMSAHASNVTGVLHTGDVLTISSGATTSSGGFVLGSGSFYGVDSNTNERITVNEATPIFGSTGYTIGKTTASAADSAIDSFLFYAGLFGESYVTGTPITGSTAAGLNMTGLTIAWGGNAIPIGSGAWQVNPDSTTTNNIMTLQTYSDSTAIFTWSGVYGEAYTLTYAATSPVGAPFAGEQYYLYLEGTVQAVPEASTNGMMLAGLGLVGFAVRRRKLVA